MILTLTILSMIIILMIPIVVAVLNEVILHYLIKPLHSGFFCFYAFVAQLVEHWIEDPGVIGSNPIGSTKNSSSVG